MRYHFANCVLDTERHLVERDGETEAVEPQVFDLLQLLVENPDMLITKDRLIEKVWQGRIVSEATISARINAARNAVGDTGKLQAVIKTVQRRGIKLVAPVEADGDRAQASTQFKSAPASLGRSQTISYATSADGTKIAYAISGAGPKVMRAGHFLTHLEMDWDSPVWKPYLEALGASHMLLRYDQRGTGMSDAELRNASVDAYAQYLLCVADEAGYDRFALVASSQGAPVSIKFAVEHPERVSALVIYGGFAQGSMHRGQAYSEQEHEALAAMIRAGWGKPKSAFMSAFTSLFCPEASSSEMENLVAIQLESASPENAVRIRDAIDNFDVTDILEDVKAPTLVIHAKGDGLHPVSQGRLLASSIPGAEFLQVNSNNHIYLPSDPAWQEIVAAQLEFIDRHADDQG